MAAGAATGSADATIATAIAIANCQHPPASLMCDSSESGAQAAPSSQLVLLACPPFGRPAPFYPSLSICPNCRSLHADEASVMLHPHPLPLQMLTTAIACPSWPASPCLACLPCSCTNCDDLHAEDLEELMRSQTD